MDVPPPPAPGASVAFSGPTPPQISPASATPVAPPSDAPAALPQTGDTTERGGLAPAVAKLFANTGIAPPAELDVSYRVLKNPNEIVTVFTDPRTGVEIAQFPPEVVIGLAEFFDQQQGATLDRNA